MADQVYSYSAPQVAAPAGYTYATYNPQAPDTPTYQQPGYTQPVSATTPYIQTYQYEQAQYPAVAAVSVASAPAAVSYNPPPQEYGQQTYPQAATSQPVYTQPAYAPAATVVQYVSAPYGTPATVYAPAADSAPAYGQPVYAGQQAYVGQPAQAPAAVHYAPSSQTYAQPAGQAYSQQQQPSAAYVQPAPQQTAPTYVQQQQQQPVYGSPPGYGQPPQAVTYTPPVQGQGFSQPGVHSGPPGSAPTGFAQQPVNFVPNQGTGAAPVNVQQGVRPTMIGNRMGQGAGFDDKKKGEEQPDTIFISGLPESISEQAIFEHFGTVGAVRNEKNSGKPKIWIFKDKATGRPKGEATVAYENMETVPVAIKMFNNKEFRGKILRVSMSVRKVNPNRDDNRSEGRRVGPPLGGPNDWTCANPSCANKNFEWRDECNRCRAPKPGSASDGPMMLMQANVRGNMPPGNMGGRGRGGMDHRGGRAATNPMMLRGAAPVNLHMAAMNGRGGPMFRGARGGPDRGREFGRMERRDRPY